MGHLEIPRYTDAWKKRAKEMPEAVIEFKRAIENDKDLRRYYICAEVMLRESKGEKVEVNNPPNDPLSQTLPQAPWPWPAQIDP